MPTTTDTTPLDEDPHPPPAQTIEFELVDPHNLLTSDDHKNIQSWSAAVFAQLQTHHNTTGSVRAKVVNDQQMSQAHQQFSGIPGTTDVLTFDLAPPGQTEDSPTLDTDLLICYDEATRQAHNQSHSPAHELLLYIIHGTLHCLGYNDHTPEDFTTMHNLEDQLLTAAGIGPLFNKPNSREPKQ